MTDFKTFEYSEKNGDATLILTEQDEEQANRRLREIVKNEDEQNWRLSHVTD